MSEKKPKKKLVVILVVVAILLLCCGGPIAVLTMTGRGITLFDSDEPIFSSPPWLYIQEDKDTFDAEVELMELLGVDLGEEYIEEVLEEDGDFDFSRDYGEVEEAKVEFEKYTNDLYPEISFEYSNAWKLTEETEESEMVDNGKNLTIILERDDYVLRITNMVMPPMGLVEMCYEKDKVEYTRIEGDIVRVVDERGYTYGYLYDSNHEKEYFEDLKDMNRVGTEEFVACGDTYILKTTSSSFQDDEFGDDNLGAIVSVMLYEQGEKNEKILSEVEDIVLEL